MTGWINVRVSKQQLVILLLLFVTLTLSLILRILPFFRMDTSVFSVHGDPDIWYNFRQIEVMLSDFPRYNWFDPMTAYPTGKYIDWGPLSPMIASFFCLVAGASLRADLIAVSSWMPVIFGLLMVPVMYYLGKVVAGWKAGIIAAFFIAVASGEYFYRTMAGVVDHHAAEIFFATMFCLFYLISLRKATESEIRIAIPHYLKPVLFPSICAGVVLAAGMAVMPTLILFALIVACFTVLMYTWNAFRGKPADYLLVMNGIISAIAIAGLAIVGVHSPVYSLATYSAAPLHAFVLLMLGTAFLQVLSVIFWGKPWIFVGTAVACAIGGIVIAALMNPSYVDSGFSALSSFFGQSFQEFPIEEQIPWSFSSMWGSFNIGIILAVIGLPLIAYCFWKKGSPGYLFLLVWGGIVLLSTVQHSRFEYYAAVFISLAAAFTLSYAFILDRSGIKNRKGNGRSSSGRKRRKGERTYGDNSTVETERSILSGLEGTGTSLVIACMVVFCGVSLISDYALASNTKNALIPQPWVDTLQWLDGVAATTGIAYLGPYEGDNWTYPSGSYSILSWWDYGHWITFLSQRIPVTNPFQDNVAPAARYFFAVSEVNANRIADRFQVRYVITDWKMADSKFPSMATWYQSTNDASLPDNYYYQKFNVIQGPSTHQYLTLKFQPYYETMVSRLHNFDGSMVSPGEVVYIEYEKQQNLRSIPRVYRYEVMNSDVARETYASFQANPPEGRGAAIVNPRISDPVERIDALQHYRLIYEGAHNPADANTTELVKTFEYVPGARLKGTGIIEVTVMTNLGRSFTYRQESVNGTFILPYATKDNPYPVRTTGPYRLTTTGKTIDVMENDVREGNAVTG